MQQHGTHFIGTRRPRNKRKDVFNSDPVTSASPQPSRQFAVEDVRPSSPCEGSPTTVHNPTSEDVALPLSGSTTLHPSSQAENMDVDPAACPAETSRKKRKRNSVLLGNGPSPEPGASNSGDAVMSPHARKKRRKNQLAASAIPIGA